MDTRTRYMLQVVLRGLRATLCSRGSAVTSSRSLLLLRPELRLLSCSHGLRRATRLHTGDRYTLPTLWIIICSYAVFIFKGRIHVRRSISFTELCYFLSHDHLPFFYWFPLVWVCQQWTAASHTSHWFILLVFFAVLPHAIQSFTARNCRDHIKPTALLCAHNDLKWK